MRGGPVAVREVTWRHLLVCEGHARASLTLTRGAYVGGVQGAEGTYVQTTRARGAGLSAEAAADIALSC